MSVMCEALGVSRSGFHGWERRAPSDRALSDAWLTERIKEIHERARGVYGSRRVTAELRLGQGVEVSRKRVQRLMRQAGISGLVRTSRASTTDKDDTPPSATSHPRTTRERQSQPRSTPSHPSARLCVKPGPLQRSLAESFRPQRSVGRA